MQVHWALIVNTMASFVFGMWRLIPFTSTAKKLGNFSTVSYFASNCSEGLAGGDEVNTVNWFISPHQQSVLRNWIRGYRSRPTNECFHFNIRPDGCHTSACVDCSVLTAGCISVWCFKTIVSLQNVHFFWADYFQPAQRIKHFLQGRLDFCKRFRLKHDSHRPWLIQQRLASSLPPSVSLCLSRSFFLPFSLRRLAQERAREGGVLRRSLLKNGECQRQIKKKEGRKKRARRK